MTAKQPTGQEALEICHRFAAARDRLAEGLWTPLATNSALWSNCLRNHTVQVLSYTFAADLSASRPSMESPHGLSLIHISEPTRR